MQNFDNIRGFFWGEKGGKGVLKFFCREKGYEKLHPLPPSTVYILNAALPNKKGGLSCDKVKFGTAIKIFGL